MGVRSAVALLVVLCPWTAHADGPAPRVLASSGTVVGDFAIARFAAPTSPADGRVVFRGITTALHLADADADRTVLRTGDALPAPLSGTVNEIVDAAVNAEGTLAVAADVNSSAATDVVFLQEGGTTIPAVVESRDVGIAGVAIDGARDLLYWGGTTISVRRTATDVSEVIGELGGTARLRLRLRPLLAAGPAAAWLATGKPGGVWFWSPDSGPLSVVRGNLKRTATVGLGVALDPTVGVAFAGSTGSAAGAFLWSRSTRTTSQLARVRERVGDATIRRLRGPVAFLEDGAVAVQVDLRRSVRPRNLPRSWVRAKDGALGLTTAPVLPVVTGPTPRLERRGALFAADRRGVTPLLGPGDAIGARDTVRSVESGAARGARVAAIVTTERGDTLPVRRRGRRYGGLAVKMPPSGAGLEGATIDVAGRDVVLLTTDGVVRGGRRRLVPLAPPRRLVRNDFLAEGIAVEGDRAVVLGAFGSCRGVFVAAGRRLRPLAVAGSPPGCGAAPLPLAGIDQVAATVGQILLIAAGPAGPVGLYRLRPGPLVRLGTTVVGSDGASVALEPLDVTFAGARPVFLAATPDDPAARQLFVAGVPTATRLLRDGDPSPVGTVRLDPDADVLGGAGDQLVVAASVRGAGVRRALLAQDVPR